MGRLHYSFAVAGILLATPALADDPFTGWTGFHAGLNLGTGFTSRSYSTSPGGTLVTDPLADSASWGSNFHGKNTTFLLGAQAGYDYQFDDMWVAGIEAEIESVDGDSGAGNTHVASLGSHVITAVGASNPWFGTVRGRLGTTWICPQFLLYVTAGLAFGNEQLDGVTTADLPGSSTPVERFLFSQSWIATGLAVGGGGEWAIDGNWSIKLEYEHIGFGHQSQTVATSLTAPPAFTTDVMTLSGSVDNENIVRAGVNYRF